MPTVAFFTEGKTVTCPEGANLREVALQCGVSVYKRLARVANCRGRGLCGTCMLSIEPTANVSAPTDKERDRRLWANVRLSCQTRVYGDIYVATMT